MKMPLVAPPPPEQHTGAKIEKICGLKNPKHSPLAKSNQYFSTSIASLANSRDITIRLHNNFSTQAKATWDTAISVLNQTYTDFNFRIVYGGTPTIFVQLNPYGADSAKNSSGCGDTWQGCGEFPTNGRVGDTLWIKPTVDTWGQPNRMYVFIHETLHNLGMFHNDFAGDFWNPGQHISGTPTIAQPETGSIMSRAWFWDTTPINGNLQWDSYNALTINDNRALQRMYPKLKNERLGDVNGDGKTDIVFINASNNSIQLRLANTSGTGMDATISCGNFGNPEGQYLIGDLDGDGKADLIFAHPNGSILWRKSTGSNFNAESQYSSGFGTVRTGIVYKILDFNGDGKSDLMYLSAFHNGNVNIKISTGSGFSTSTLSQDFGEIGGQYFVGDFNGDNREDIFCAIRPGQVQGSSKKGHFPLSRNS